MMNCELEAMALEMPEVQAHPNRLPFRGVLTLVGVPSRRSPSGARSHRVMLTRKATEAALPSLLGMALDYAPALNAHDQRRKIGVITEAEIVALGQTPPTPPKEGGMGHPAENLAQGLKPEIGGVESARLKSCPDAALLAQEATRRSAEARANTHQCNQRGSAFGVNAQTSASSNGCGLKSALDFISKASCCTAEAVPLQGSQAVRDPGSQVAVSGFLYAHDFADVVEELRAGCGTLGMSYEITDAGVVSPASPIWTVTSFTFTGAAVLKKASAAYPETWMEIG